MHPADRRPLAPPFLTEIREGILVVVVCRDGDVGMLRPDWPLAIIKAHPGPFQSVEVDLSQRGAMNSSFYAGLIRLHHAYVRAGVALVLVQPDPLVVRDLRSMRLDGMFTIAARTA